MNLTAMILLVRQDLRDADPLNYRWTDAELERHINHALKEFSEEIPLPARVTLATTSGSREVSLSTLTGRVAIQSIEYPVGQDPPSCPGFSLNGDTLTINMGEIPDGSNCLISYGQLHTLNAETSTIPTVFEELLAAGACGYAALAFALYSINRINNGGENAPASLSEWGQNKLAAFRSELKRLGRRNKVRTSGMYVAD